MGDKSAHRLNQRMILRRPSASLYHYSIVKGPLCEMDQQNQ